ncbi:MAG: hypothetical protein QXJ06_04140 [Candidatus Aenigmatarchaeota archaeon]
MRQKNRGYKTKELKGSARVSFEDVKEFGLRERELRVLMYCPQKFLKSFRTYTKRVPHRWKKDLLVVVKSMYGIK